MSDVWFFLINSQFPPGEKDIALVDVNFETREDLNDHQTRVHAVKLGRKTIWLPPSVFEFIIKTHLTRLKRKIKTRGFRESGPSSLTPCSFH